MHHTTQGNICTCVKPQPGTPQAYNGFCQLCGGYMSNELTPTTNQTKVCYTCKYLATNEDLGQWRFHGGDITPTDSFRIFCKLAHWSYYEGPVEELRTGLLKAHDCVDYTVLPSQLSQQPQQPVEDYVGHIHRPPYCNACHSNLVVQAGVLGKYPYNNEITQYVSFCPTCHPTLRMHPTLQGVAYHDS